MSRRIFTLLLALLLLLPAAVRAEKMLFEELAYVFGITVSEVLPLIIKKKETGKLAGRRKTVNV